MSAASSALVCAAMAAYGRFAGERRDSARAAQPERAALASDEPDLPIVAVVGPTASGKTALAVAFAEALGGEVISADSVQIYRRFDAGSGKPTAAELARARHHLVGVCDPLDAIDASSFAARAEAALADLRARGRVPVVCGGTFLWVRALLRGLVDAPPASAELRAEHVRFVEAEGAASLHARLSAVDPRRAAELHENDVVRVSRALEVHALTGTPQSELHLAHGFAETRHPAWLVGVRHEPAALDARIRERVRLFLQSGWAAEVETLLAEGYGSARAMGSVGYKQVRDFVEGRLAEGDLEDAIVRATRVFVRRQRTWLRDEPVAWLDAAGGDAP